jgi:hypothetical protein
MPISNSVRKNRLSLCFTVARRIALASVLSVSGFTLAAADSQQIQILTLSNLNPNLVSGGDVLVALVVPEPNPLDQVRVRLNGSDVTSAFRVNPATGLLTGLVTGLRPGNNHLRARAGQLVSRITIVNHAITGPLFYAPSQQPFVCQTQDFQLPVTGGTLGMPLDTDCSIATRVDYIYKSTDGTLQPLPDPTVRPADLAQTTTTEGHSVDYIARIETGTINRAVYQIAFLQEPGQPIPDPWTTTPAWNKRLIYSYGGGCKPGYHQGTTTGGVQNDLWLSRGYAVAASSLNVFGNNCDDVLSAETTIMVKEHFIEQYGVPRYTIGWGTSGGSMQQHLIAHNYPGLLDGITPGRSFPDALTFFLPISDCPLLRRVFDISTEKWTTEQKAAVGGWGTWDFCTTHASSDYSALVRAGESPDTPASGCDPGVPPELVYDPVKNPTGARCSFFDDLIKVFGADPTTGFARRAIDSVGVQYGLTAFNSGQISADQFVELNEVIGGYDVDGNMVPTRTASDEAALRIAYQTGRLDTGSGGLGSVPIIDYRAYRDLIADPHDSTRSHIERARLIAANGNADNQVILVSSPDATPEGAAIFALLQADVLRLMDEWLENIANDSSPFQTLAEKVVRNKPPELVDACYSDTGVKITDPATCRLLYPFHGNPRIASGEPLANNILKCALKPLDASDYAQKLTREQLARLNTVFPDGVCDYSQPGVEQQQVAGTWILSFPDFW